MKFQLSFVTCALMLSLFHGQAYGQIDPRLDDMRAQREDAEKKVIEEFCSKTDAQSILKLSLVGFESDDGLVCAQKIIAALSINRIGGDPGLISASESIWRLVERAIIRVDRRQPIRALLEKIRVDLNHPLRSEAWLGLKVLDKEEGVLVRQGTPLRSISIPATHLYTLLPTEPSGIKQQLESSSPSKRNALIWLLSEHWRKEISNAPTSSASAPSIDNLERLSRVYGNYGSLAPNMLSVFIDELFTEYLFLSPKGTTIPSHGSDKLPEMEFSLKGSACSDGGQCRVIDTTTSSATNLLYLQTTALNDTLSQSQVFLPFLYSGNSEFKLKMYSGEVQSYVGGGRWTERTIIGNILTDAGDGTATVNYTLQGIAKIPVCGDPLTCTVQVEIISSMPASNNEANTISSLQLDGPTGKIDFPTGSGSQQLIDRSLGDYTLSLKLSRNASHRGSCCADWRGHAFYIEIRKPGSAGAPNLIFGIPQPSFKPTFPPGVDPVFAGSLLGFQTFSMELQPRISHVQPTQPITFNSIFPPSTIAYDNRFAELWARASIAHLALQWSTKDLLPAEANTVAGLRVSLSERARGQLAPALLAELQAWSFAFEALDPTPLLLVVAALVRDTELTTPLDDAEAKIVARIAENASGELGASLMHAKQALDAVRNGQPKVDAILSLMSLEEDFVRKGREARSKYDRLAREIAQLNQGSP